MVKRLVIGIGAIVFILNVTLIVSIMAVFVSGSRIEGQSPPTSIVPAAEADRPILVLQEAVPTASPSPTYTPYPVNTPAPAPTSTPRQVPTPTPTATTPRPTLSPAIPSPALTIAAPSQLLLVGNTDGDGVYVSRAPATSDRLRAWPDGTPMVIIGPDFQSGSEIWKKVRDPEGDEGWIPIDYLVAP